jgi:hypothetical protein
MGGKTEYGDKKKCEVENAAWERREAPETET